MFCDFFLLNKTINIEIEIGWSGGGVGRVREGGGELNHFAFMASTRNNPRLLPTPQLFQLHSAFPAPLYFPPFLWNQTLETFG